MSQNIPLRQHKRILLLPTNKGIEAININQIVRVEALSNYSKLYFANNKTLVVAKVLRWFEERLAPDYTRESKQEAFLRIHRKHLINKNFIQQYLNVKGGKIELNNGEWLDVSKRKKSNFLKCWYVNAA